MVKKSRSDSVFFQLRNVCDCDHLPMPATEIEHALERGKFSVDSGVRRWCSEVGFLLLTTRNVRQDSVGRYVHDLHSPEVPPETFNVIAQLRQSLFLVDRVVVEQSLGNLIEGGLLWL